VKVAILDDCPDLLDAIKQMFSIIKEELPNLEITTTTDFKVILRNMNNYDVIYCDHRMPISMGHEFFQELMRFGYKGHFVHFSSEPVPEVYYPHVRDESLFHVCNKTGIMEEGVQLLKKLYVSI